MAGTEEARKGMQKASTCLHPIFTQSVIWPANLRSLRIGGAELQDSLQEVSKQGTGTRRKLRHHSFERRREAICLRGLNPSRLRVIGGNQCSAAKAELPMLVLPRGIALWTLLLCMGVASLRVGPEGSEHRLQAWYSSATTSTPPLILSERGLVSTADLKPGAELFRVPRSAWITADTVETTNDIFSDCTSARGLASSEVLRLAIRLALLRMGCNSKEERFCAYVSTYLDRRPQQRGGH